MERVVALKFTERTELFINWYAWSLKYKDCDPAVWATNYLNERYEHNDEERIWLCWLYGNTYQLPTAWVLKNEFPDFELCTIDRLKLWNSQNYKRLRYQTDTKWNKGHLPAMFESYKKFIGSASQRSVLESYYGDTEEQNFDNLWRGINDNLYKFGRYSVWFYLQHLHHTAGIRVVPTSLMLSDHSGSRSHRNGLLYAISKDDYIDRKLDANECAALESIAFDILQETSIRYPELRSEINFFTMETCLCSFKKIFREHHGRYLGYYLDRQSEEIQQAERDGWTGIEWEVLWQARDETLDTRLVGRNNINKEKFTSFVRSGKIERLEWLFGDDHGPAHGTLEALWE
jgi:hypothetical protein